MQIKFQLFSKLERILRNWKNKIFLYKFKHSLRCNIAQDQRVTTMLNWCYHKKDYGKRIDSLLRLPFRHEVNFFSMYIIQFDVILKMLIQRAKMVRVPTNALCAYK